VKKTIILLILPFLLLVSCDLFQKQTWPKSVNVVCIGLNYKGTDLDSHDTAIADGVLYGTLNDAAEIQEAFSQLYGSRIKSSSLMVQEGRTGGSYDTITSALPTKANVMERLRSLPAADLTIVTYSGHGNTGTGALALAPPDTVVDPNYGTKGCLYDGKTLREECLLDLTTLIPLLDGIQGKVLLVLDSCYSGNAVAENGGSISLVEDGGNAFENAWSGYWGDRSYQTHLYALTATTSDNYSWDEAKTSDHPHGYFSEAFLDAFGWDHANRKLTGTMPAERRNTVSLDSIYQYIMENQKIPISGNRVHQHPMLFQGADTLCLTTM